MADAPQDPAPGAPPDPARRGPYLLVLSGPQFGELFDVTPGREVLIGRRADADVHLHDDGISRRHASVLVRDGVARLADLGSQNGTFLEGARITEAELRDGARFQVGAHTTVKYVASDDLESATQRALAAAAHEEPLTRLFNRRHFVQRLGAELAAAQRHGRALSLLLLDLDHFARINDEHGHAAGDEVLRTVAGVLRGAVRKEDLVARFGGEEFVVLARETGLGGARTLADRIRRAVERARTRCDGREVAVTVSIGVAVSVGLTRFEPGRTEAQVLAAADGALQRAKQRGRNAVVAAPALGE
jgi:diguanylate cyclase (GGDEF)-like protein